MDHLAILFSSSSRASILRALFVSSAKPVHVRELARRCGCSLSVVQREVKKLSTAELIREHVSGNRTYLDANTEHPFYPELVTLVAKSEPLFDRLAEALSGGSIQVAFVFGSFSRSEEHLRSDVDLMIIGDLSLHEVAGRLTSIRNESGLELNPHIFSVEEWRQRIAASDHFVTSVIRESKQFLIGDKDELERVASERLAKGSSP
jgi:predicted nucleotidyltransferase